MAYKKVRTVTVVLKDLGKLVVHVNLNLPNMEINRPKCKKYYAHTARRMLVYKLSCLAAFVQTMSPRKFRQKLQGASKLQLINEVFNAGAEEQFFSDFRFEFPGKKTGMSYSPSKSWLEISTGSPEGNI